MTERLHFHFSLSCIGKGNGNPLQCSCLENPRDGRAWWAAVYGVAQSRTRLKRLSSSSSNNGDGLCTHIEKNSLKQQHNMNIMSQITKHIQAHWPLVSQQIINISSFIWRILSALFMKDTIYQGKIWCGDLIQRDELMKNKCYKFFWVDAKMKTLALKT